MGIAIRAMALVAVCCGPLFAQAPQWRNLYPSYTGLTFGDGKFMAVSSDGLIKTTVDGGESWSQYFAAHSLSGAAYGDGRFFVTQPNRLMYSLDGGGNWTTEIRDNSPCRYLTFGKSRFIGIGQAGRTFVYDPEDGLGWRTVQPEESHSTNLLHAAFGNNVFVAVGSNIVSSGNGDGWTERRSGFTGTVNLVVYGNDKFAALSSQGGMAYTSDDGNEWTPQPSSLPAGMADAAFGGGKFAAVGSAGAAVTSSDGVAWTPSTGLNPSDDFKAVRYGDGLFMALGASGSVYTSPDGGTWTSKAVGRTMSYKEIAFGGGKYVAVGDSGASVSPDGLNWSRGAASEGSFKGLQHVAFGADKFVAVGDSGALYVSADGAAWVNASRNNQMMFTGVAFGNETFVVVGYMGSTANGTPCVLTSDAGGQNWKEATNINSQSGWPSMYPISLGYGNGIFLAGSSTGTLRSSSDGIYWSNEAPPAAPAGTSYRYRSINYVSNRFIVTGTATGGDNFTIIMSSNGTAWTTITAPANMAVRSVTFAKSYYYIAVGDSGKIMASPSGQEWFTQKLATNKNLQTVYTSADGNTIIAGGADGAILYSTDNPILVSVRYAQATPKTSTRSLTMNLEKNGKTPVVSLSFTPKTPGTIAVYSLTGRQLFKKNVCAGERRVPLSKRISSSGSVIVKYTGGDGITVARRFQAVK